jgi:hypothetical protein
MFPAIKPWPMTTLVLHVAKMISESLVSRSLVLTLV